MFSAYLTHQSIEKVTAHASMNINVPIMRSLRKAAKYFSVNIRRKNNEESNRPLHAQNVNERQNDKEKQRKIGPYTRRNGMLFISKQTIDRFVAERQEHIYSSTC